MFSHLLNLHLFFILRVLNLMRGYAVFNKVLSGLRAVVRHVVTHGKMRFADLFLEAALVAVIEHFQRLVLHVLFGNKRGGVVDRFHSLFVEGHEVVQFCVSELSYGEV